MARAGPAVSAVLGAAFVGASPIGGPPAAIGAVLEWLGWTDVILLAFNLLRALPLDGGRVPACAPQARPRDAPRAGATRSPVTAGHADRMAPA